MYYALFWASSPAQLAVDCSTPLTLLWITGPVPIGQYYFFSVDPTVMEVSQWLHETGVFSQRAQESWQIPVRTKAAALLLRDWTPTPTCWTPLPKTITDHGLFQAVCNYLEMDSAMTPYWYSPVFLSAAPMAMMMVFSSCWVRFLEQFPSQVGACWCTSSVYWIWNEAKRGSSMPTIRNNWSLVTFIGGFFILYSKTQPFTYNQGLCFI